VTEPFRCSAASRTVGEPLVGTASTVQAFVLVERAGPWGVNAVRDCRLPGEVKAHLLALQREHRVRPLLIRRPGRAQQGPSRVFVGYAGGRAPWLETHTYDDLRALLDVDLTRLAQGRSPGLEAHPDPTYLVCTHGRHDACCAELGRPLAAALARVAPEATWEVSHIGGDRFAGNVLVLPYGLYYGRVEPGHAAAFDEHHRAGRLDLERLRGRSSYRFSVQAAEIYLRRHLGRHDLGRLPLRHHTREDDLTRVAFEVDGTSWWVTVRSGQQDARLLTCRAARHEASPIHTLLDISADRGHWSA
jgi:hypothetical protein